MLGQKMDEMYGPSARDLRSTARQPGGAGARAALETFYFAFNSRSLETLDSIWAPDASVSLANPLGGVLIGADGIHALYQRIFEGTARVWVEYHDVTEYADVSTFLYVGRERGEFATDQHVIPLAIRTTRVFRYLEGAGWRQVHHHGSIDDPELLARYQRAVRGKVPVIP